VKQISKALYVTGILLILTGCLGKTDSASTHVPAATPKNHMKVITVYSIEPDSLQLVPVSVKKEKDKPTAEYIVSLVKSNLSAYNIKTPVLKKKGKKLYVSFSSKGEPVKNCNKKVEKLILECFANSLLDNVSSCRDIIFQIDGEAYISDNFEFGADEIYASR
jgi:hypothetical protein